MIAIITPTYNNVEMLVRCVESIRDLTIDVDWRMVVVDNGSTDGTADYLRDVSSEDRHIRAISLESNRGFVGGTNEGLRTVQDYEHVLLLNDDTQVCHGDWLSLLRSTLDDPKVGAVGPISNYASAWQMASESYHIPRLVHSTGVLIGFCMFIRNSAFLQVGLLDERFNGCQWDDYDYSLRLIEAGWGLRVRRDVFMLHYGSQTTGRNGKGDFAGQLARGRQILINKWGEDRLKSALAVPEDLREEAKLA